MKTTKYLLIVALFGFALVTSCTPENIEDEQTEQQVDANKVKLPAAG